MSLSLTPESKILKDFAKDLNLQKRRSPLTVKAYLDVLKKFSLHWSQKNAAPPALDRLQGEDLQSYLQHISKKLAASSQALHVGALRCFFKWCVQKKLSHSDFALYLTRPKVPKKLQKVVDEEDLVFLVREIEKRPPQEQLLFQLLYGSGLRISEAYHLKKEDLNLARKELRIVGKGKKERRVPMTPKAFELLRDFYATAPTPSPWPEGLSLRTLQKWAENWGKLSLLSEETGRLHPHKLRHSIATHLLRRGASLPELQRLLGHQRLSTTERYTHLNFEDLARVYDQAIPEKLKK